ncbi:MAG: hypothetical protein Q8K82_06090 [Gemmatimonadaceae bacterium]|nr:hypothetical protein [Gemmatimonadaceae bacterium]
MSFSRPRHTLSFCELPPFPVYSSIVGGTVTKLEKLEAEIRRLSARKLATFRAWLAEFDAAAWDGEIERDAEAGRFDSLARFSMLCTRRKNFHCPSTVLRKRSVNRRSMNDRQCLSPQAL